VLSNSFRLEDFFSNLGVKVRRQEANYNIYVIQDVNAVIQPVERRSLCKLFSNGREANDQWRLKTVVDRT
jgi:hypothetical protein